MPWQPWMQLSSGVPNVPWKVQAYTKYCKKCGRLLLPCSTNEDGSENHNLELEQQVGMHYDCYQRMLAEMAPQMEQAMKAQEEQSKAESDKKYEDAVQKYMEELAKRNGHNPSADT